MAVRRGDIGKITESDVAAWRGRGQLPLFHVQVVGKRLYINAQIRFLVAFGIAGGALFAKHVLAIGNLHVAGLMAVAALLFVFNTGIFVVARRHRDLEKRASVHRFLMALMHLTISVDFVFLTAALWLVGGVKSPFVAFYLLHVILAAALLIPRAAWAHAAFGFALFTGLAIGQWLAVLPVYLPVGLVNSAQPLDGRYVSTALAVTAAMMALSVFLLTGLTNLVRHEELQLRETNGALERLSRLQRDFLHIALHDLKAPVNAAAMLLDGLKVASNPALSEHQSHWIMRIQVRLNEVMAFLHDLSTMAVLEAVDIEKQAEEIDVAALVRQVVEENQELAQSHHHSLRVEVSDGLPRPRGIPLLVHEALANLVVNALRYTPDHGAIVVRARRENDSTRVEVEDNGIGIAPEDQKRLFHEFVRIRRKDSPTTDVSGSGLGLSIVHRAADMHGGRVGVRSELNKGSTFYIELPLRPPEKPAST